MLIVCANLYSYQQCKEFVSKVLCSPRDEEDLKIKAKEGSSESVRENGVEVLLNIMVSPSNLLRCDSWWHFVLVFLQ